MLLQNSVPEHPGSQARSYIYTLSSHHVTTVFIAPRCSYNALLLNRINASLLPPDAMRWLRRQMSGNSFGSVQQYSPNCVHVMQQAAADSSTINTCLHETWCMHSIEWIVAVPTDLKFRKRACTPRNRRTEVQMHNNQCT